MKVKAPVRAPINPLTTPEIRAKNYDMEASKLTFGLDAILEIAWDIFEEVSWHSPHLKSFDEVKCGRMKTFNSNIGKIFGMSNVKAWVTERADITGRKALIKLLLFLLSPLINLRERRFEISLLLPQPHLLMDPICISIEITVGRLVRWWLHFYNFVCGLN